MTGISVSSTIRRSSDSPRRPVAHVHVDDAGLAGQDAAAARLGGHAGELVEGRLGRAVVRERHLADADDLVDEEQVALDAPGQRLHGHGVVAGVDERAQALVVQAARLGEQAGRGAGDAVGAEAPDDRRDAAADGVRRARARACAWRTRPRRRRPMMCTWPSMKPGTATRPVASTCSQYFAGSSMSGSTRRIRPPAIRMSARPIAAGA